MPTFQVPSIDQSIAQTWSIQDQNLYQKLPFYLAKTQADYIKTWAVWRKLMGRRPWKPNMGPTMRGERYVPSPHLRQTASPSPLTGTPKVDVIGVRSTSVDEILYWQHFESQYFYFLNNFQDFLTQHVERCRTDIQEKMQRFEDIWLRGRVFNKAPEVWLPNRAAGEAYAAPSGVDFTTGKTTAWLQQAVATLGQPGSLTLDTLSRLLTHMSTDLRVPAFSGGDLPKDDQGLMGKYCLICSTEAFERFTFDPYVKVNKTLDFDIVTGGYKGSIFGRITCKLEDMPIRFQADGTMPAPETIELNPNAYNYGETIPNPVYTDPAQSPYEVAYLAGAKGYETIDSGPPPALFQGKGIPEGFGKLMWNGEIQMTKDILIPVLDENGTMQWQTNKYGKYLQLISTLTLGCMPVQPRNIVPIIFKRVRGNVSTTGA